MCNRYRLSTAPDALYHAFGSVVDGAPSQRIDAEYYPGKAVPVVVQAPTGLHWSSMTWGFPPFKGSRPVNNTRSETCATSPYWRRHLGTRCVFPLTAAIEWQHRVDRSTGELRKVPHALSYRDGRIGLVAGIWMEHDGAARCSMLTCRANATWAAVHNAAPDDPRMVCLLSDHAAVGAWLDAAAPFAAVQYPLGQAPDELIQAVPLSP